MSLENISYSSVLILILKVFAKFLLYDIIQYVTNVIANILKNSIINMNYYKYGEKYES